jgi:hypothetical protein
LQHNPDLVNYFEAFHSLVHCFYQNARMSLSQRDEDIQFPPHLEDIVKKDPKLVLSALSDYQSNVKKGNAISEAIGAHFKFIEALLLVSLNTFDKSKLEFPAQEEQKQSKKKKKGK